MPSGDLSGLRILLEARLDQADREGNLAARLAILRDWLRVEPENSKVREAANQLSAHLADSPAVVCIERARVAGRSIRSHEGGVYIEEPDGRLRPASGEDLARSEARFPGFLKNWRLDED